MGRERVYERARIISFFPRCMHVVPEAFCGFSLSLCESPLEMRGAKRSCSWLRGASPNDKVSFFQNSVLYLSVAGATRWEFMPAHGSVAQKRGIVLQSLDLLLKTQLGQSQIGVSAPVSRVHPPRAYLTQLNLILDQRLLKWQSLNWWRDELFRSKDTLITWISKAVFSLFT